MLDRYNPAVPRRNDAGFPPMLDGPGKAIVVNGKVLRPVIEVQVVLAANGRAPADAAGLVEDADGDAAVRQQLGGGEPADSGPHNAD
jgi:hypothetical protein